MNQQPNWTSIIQRHLDGLTTSQEAEALSTQIVTNPGIREQYLKAAQVHAALTDEFLAQENLEKPTPKDTPAQKKTVSIHFFAPVGIAALLMISLLAFFWPKDRENEELLDEWGSSIAKIEFLSEDARFGGDQELTRGSSLEKGWLQLAAGSTRLKFRSGAIVTLQAPAAFGLDSPMRSYLEYGKVEVYAPESARDFVVATESMEVVDLGTRFELVVDQDTRESAVSVSEGLVDLHLGTPGTQRRIQPLEAGFSAQVDSAGDILTLKRTQVEKPVAPRLVAHWKLDEAPSSDEVESIPGIAGRAVQLGERGFVDVSDWAEKLGRTGDFTIAAWVRNPSDRIAVLFSLSDGTEADRVQFHLNRRHLVFGWQNGAHYDAVNGKIDQWEPDRWYHVAVTMRRGMIHLYRDGEQVGSSSAGHKIGTRISSLSSVERPTHCYLGKLSAERPQFFGGAIDDVQIYAKAVLGKNIRYLYEHPGELWDPRGTDSDK